MENGTSSEDDRITSRQLYSQVLEQEKELRNLLKKKNVLDKSVTTLRNSIREQYEKLLFLDFDFALAKDIEQNLWKTVFYKVIEEFRKRIRKSAVTVAATTDNSQVAALNEEQQKTCTAFKAFLSSASRFYLSLIQRFLTKYNLILDGSIDFNQLVLPPENNEQPKLHRSYLSCHRCLIFLGDLARYHRDIGGDTQKDWNVSGSYYQQALNLFPDNGNPHNQLAVLATYSDDECNAVYRYFRSLAVLHPFLTARDNLIVLFEKNRLKINALSKKYDQPPKSMKGKKTEKVKHESTDEQMKNFLTAFVRLHGILFTKTSLETFNTVKANVLRDLDSLFKKNAIPDTLLLRMLVINIFSIHNISYTPEGHKTTYSEISQRSVLQKYATKFSVEFFGRVVRAFRFNNTSQDTTQEQPKKEFETQLEKKEKPNTSASGSLGAISTFLEWLKDRPEVMRPEVNQEKRPWVNMWKAIAKLLNHLSSNVADIGSLANLNRTGLPLLTEEIELRGFLPLNEALQSLPFGGEHAELPEEDKDDYFYKVRLSKIHRFGLTVANSTSESKLLYFSPEERKFSVRPFSSKKKLAQSLGLSEDTNGFPSFSDAINNPSEIVEVLPPLDNEDATFSSGFENGTPRAEELANIESADVFSEPLLSDSYVDPKDELSPDRSEDPEFFDTDAEVDDEVILFRPGKRSENTDESHPPQPAIGSGRIERESSRNKTFYGSPGVLFANSDDDSLFSFQPRPRSPSFGNGTSAPPGFSFRYLQNEVPHTNGQYSEASPSATPSSMPNSSGFRFNDSAYSFNSTSAPSSPTNAYWAAMVSSSNHSFFTSNPQVSESPAKLSSFTESWGLSSNGSSSSTFQGLANGATPGRKLTTLFPWNLAPRLSHETKMPSEGSYGYSMSLQFPYPGGQQQQHSNLRKFVHSVTE